MNSEQASPICFDLSNMRNPFTVRCHEGLMKQLEKMHSHNFITNEDLENDYDPTPHPSRKSSFTKPSTSEILESNRETSNVNAKETQESKHSQNRVSQEVHLSSKKRKTSLQNCFLDEKRPSVVSVKTNKKSRLSPEGVSLFIQEINFYSQALKNSTFHKKEPAKYYHKKKKSQTIKLEKQRDRQSKKHSRSPGERNSSAISRKRKISDNSHHKDLNIDRKNRIYRNSIKSQRPKAVICQESSSDPVDCLIEDIRSSLLQSWKNVRACESKLNPPRFSSSRQSDY